MRVFVVWRFQVVLEHAVNVAFGAEYKCIGYGLQCGGLTLAFLQSLNDFKASKTSSGFHIKNYTRHRFWFFVKYHNHFARPILMCLKILAQNR